MSRKKAAQKTSNWFRHYIWGVVALSLAFVFLFGIRRSYKCAALILWGSTSSDVECFGEADEGQDLRNRSAPFPTRAEILASAPEPQSINDAPLENTGGEEEAAGEQEPVHQEEAQEQEAEQVQGEKEKQPQKDSNGNATSSGEQRRPTEEMAAEVRARFPPLHFWSFGNGKWKKALGRIGRQANKTFLFQDRLHLYDGVPAGPRGMRSQKRWRRHVASERGGGYWFWKSALTQVILDTKMKDDEILVYADSGCSIGNKAANFQAWTRLLNQTKQYDIITFRVEHEEYRWTKGDIFREFNVSCDSHGYGQAKQLMATTFLMVRNKKTRAFVNHWVSLVENFQLINDEISRDMMKFYCKNFRENRHDQSIWSMLVKANQPTWPNASLHRGAKGSNDWTTDFRWAPEDEGWEPQPRHSKYGVEGLRILVLRDMTWPPNTRIQAISATRKTKGGG